MTLAGRVLIAFALLLVTLGVQAQLVPAADRQFIRLEKPWPVTSGDKIEVIEFFYYGCPVCYELEPALSRWSVKAPADVVLRRVPALASASWENFARLF